MATSELSLLLLMKFYIKNIVMWRNFQSRIENFQRLLMRYEKRNAAGEKF